MIYTYRPVFIHSRHIPVSRYAREFILLVSIPFIIRFERIWNVNKSLIWVWKPSPMWWNHLLMRNLIFYACMNVNKFTYWMRASPWTGQYLRTAERQTWLSNDMQCDSGSLILMVVIIYHLFLAKCNMYTFVWYHGRSRLRLRNISVKETTMIPRW